MRYHIQTTPIWDAFKEHCDCPMCKLYDKINDRLVKQYLDEAVMEPDYRIKVNKYGFCSEHLRELFLGGNKLGLALQINTRTDAVVDSISTVKNAGQAKKLAEKLDKTIDTCVICQEINNTMERYAYTIAEMYLYEEDFPALFEKSNGFCLPHFILLLKYLSHAGKKQAQYGEALTRKQTEAMKKLNGEVERFTKRFDYRSTDRYAHGNDDALERAINKLKGKIIK